MPRCENCNSFVTVEYTRVFTPEDRGSPEACPFCPDKVREGGKVRDARSSRF